MRARKYGFYSHIILAEGVYWNIKRDDPAVGQVEYPLWLSQVSSSPAVPVQSRCTVPIHESLCRGSILALGVPRCRKDLVSLVPLSRTFTNEAVRFHYTATDHPENEDGWRTYSGIDANPLSHKIEKIYNSESIVDALANGDTSPYVSRYCGYLCPMYWHSHIWNMK